MWQKNTIKIKLKGLALFYVFNLMNSEYMNFAVFNIHYIVLNLIKLLTFYDLSNCAGHMSENVRSDLLKYSQYVLHLTLNLKH